MLCSLLLIAGSARDHCVVLGAPPGTLGAEMLLASKLYSHSLSHMGPCSHTDAFCNSLHVAPRDGRSAGLYFPRQWFQYCPATFSRKSITLCLAKGFQFLSVPRIQCKTLDESVKHLHLLTMLLRLSLILKMSLDSNSAPV